MKQAVRILSVLGILAATALSIAAQDDSTVTVTFSESQPQRLDPHAGATVDDFLVLRNVCEGLIDYDPVTLQPIPGLAESWTISDDGLVYTFTLRGGITFSDGNALDANDVKYFFDRLSDPLTGTSYTAGLILRDVAGWAEARPANRAVGEGTPTPVSEFAQNDHLTLIANPNYWGIAPEVQTAIIRVIPEASSQVIEFEAGNLDISEAPEADLSRLMADETLSTQIITIPSLGLYNLRMNLKDPKMCVCSRPYRWPLTVSL